jgi:hypothetical protein
MPILDLARKFPRYREFDSAVPVYCLTPNMGGVIHRFFDTSPISPSGRYLAATRFPCEDRSPRPGEAAQVVVVDLETGTEILVAETRGWDTQLGAQAQWGASDDGLFFNDIDTRQWTPFGVRMNIDNGDVRHLEGTVYHVSPDGKQAASPCLLRTARTQLGYGVLVPPQQLPVNQGAPDDDGVFVTDTETGQKRLLISLRRIVDECPTLQGDQYRKGHFYAFHVKWNPQGDRLMVIVRWVPARRFWQCFQRMRKAKAASKKTMRKHVITLAADGTDVHVAVNAEDWARGGHHPNWCPDGRHVMMNLNADGSGLRFVRFRYDGGPVEVLHSRILGSGHPSLHPSERYLLTDAYPSEPAGFGDGTVPIRLIDLHTGTEQILARIKVNPDYLGPSREMRVDAHPAWDATGTWVVFNGFPNGTRQVFAADTRAITAG